MRMRYHYDGKTSGPCSFTGPVDELIQNCGRKNVYRFNLIEVPSVSIDATVFSTHQKYLLEIYEAVSSGRVSGDL